MTRPNSAFVLRRTSERLTAGVAAVAATLLMLLAVNVRAAETDPNPPRIEVSYSDFEITTQKGAENVYRKLRSAARKVCGAAPGGSLNLDQETKAKKCVNAALADAVRRIDRPTLTSLHEANAPTSRDLG